MEDAQKHAVLTAMPTADAKALRQPLQALAELDPNSAKVQWPYAARGKETTVRRSLSVSTLDARFMTVRDDRKPFCNLRAAAKEAGAAGGLAREGFQVEQPAAARLCFAQKVPAPSPVTASCDSAYESEYAIDILTYLLEQEEKTPFPTFLKSTRSRAFVLNWLIDANGDGDPSVVQTAAWYLDAVMQARALATRHLPVAMSACFWVAKKIHGRACTAEAVVARAGHVFDAEHLCLVEARILKLLKFPRQPVLAQEFLRYMVWWCEAEQPSELLACATFVYVNALAVRLDMCRQLPSVAAAAAVRTALLLLGKRRAAQTLRGCFVYQAAAEKGEMVDVCIWQIEALRMFFSRHFEFTAAERLLRQHAPALQRLERQLDFLYRTGGEGIIRAFLMN